MAKTRSPNYPVLTLGEALEAIRPAFKAENRNKMSRLVLAGHLGYTSLNGRALGKIGAVRAYGLIEGTGDNLRVSDDAISSLTAPAGPEKQAALARCALHSKLFTELHEQFPDNKVSLENLKYQLIQRRFSQEGAAKAAENYLDTISLVFDDNPNAPLVEQSEIDEDAKNTDGDDTPPDPPLDQNAKPGLNQDMFAMKEGTVVLQWPDSLSPESYEDFEDWLRVILRKVKRHVVMNQTIRGAMPTAFSNDAGGREAERRDRELHEQSFEATESDTREDNLTE